MVLTSFFDKQGCCFLDRLVTCSQLTGLRSEKTGIQTQVCLAPRHVLSPLYLVSFEYSFFSFFFCLPFCSPLSVVQVASFKWLTTASKSWAVTSSPTYQSFLLDTSCLKTVQRTWSSVSKPSNLNWHHLFLSAFSVVADLPASYTPADCPPAPSHPAYAAGSSGMLHMSSSNCDGTPQPVTSHTLLLTAP